MNGVFLDWAATNPIVRFPVDTSKQWRNPNAAYAYEERKVLMDCEECIKAAIGANGGHVLYFRCATDAMEWLHSEGNKCMMAWAHSPYEHDAAMFGIEAKPDELVGADFYCHQLVNQLTGEIHDIKAVHERLLQYDDAPLFVPFLICDCTAAIHHISLRAAKVCQYADAVVTSGHKYGCPDIAFILPYAPVYGELKESNGILYFTNYHRTGCVFCGFGCHLEKEPNRFQTLAQTHPQLYDYCMRGGKYDDSGKWVPDKGLGMAKVLDFINVKWWNDGDEAKRDEYRAKYKDKELNK